MNDTMITVVGNVVDSPRKVRAGNGTVTKFRVASTARRFDAGAQQWVDGATFYIDVECWNDLGSHVSGSVGGGDPVIVLGTISTDEWETDGGRRSRPRIRARSVGHDLSRGIASFVKVKRPVAALGAPAGPAEDGPAADPDDEEFLGAVDRLTGEVLDPAAGDPSDPSDAIVRGRDYVVGGPALHGQDADDLEPAQA